MVSSKKHSSAKDNTATHSGKKKVSNAREYGESLVGSRIRVWWPIDREFYEGVVDSFDSSRKKHRVLYDDGDQENLDMKKERWELIEDVDAKADEIALQDESTYEGADATPEPKRAEKGSEIDDIPRKKQKIDSSLKRAGATKDKQTPKPEPGINGKMGDVGGKIVAAASRMSGRFRNKENGKEKETPKSLKSSKKISASNNRKQKRGSSSSEAVSEKVKKPRTSSKKIKSDNSDVEDGEDNDVNTSNDESKPLVSFLKKSPEAVEAMMRKLKVKKGKEAGEGSSEAEAETEAKEGEAEEEAKAEGEAEEEAKAEVEVKAEAKAEVEAEAKAEVEAEAKAEVEAEAEAEVEAEVKEEAEAKDEAEAKEAEAEAEAKEEAEAEAEAKEEVEAEAEPEVEAEAETEAKVVEES